MMRVCHMSGAGNDFVVVDVRGQSVDLEKLAITLCTDTGADGFMAVDYADGADFKLHFYNPDGLRGEMCGNGARCVCKFAYDKGIAGAEMTLLTDAGPVYGRRLEENRYLVRLNEPGVVDLVRRQDCAYVELGQPGIPHGVVEVPGLDWSMGQLLWERGRALRYDPAFPKGANINFYTLLEDGQARLLTYERGVEDYTLACGTGSASVAVVLWLTGRLPGGVLTAHNRGGILTVSVEGNAGKVEKLLLEGPAEVLKEYEI